MGQIEAGILVNKSGETEKKTKQNETDQAFDGNYFQL